MAALPTQTLGWATQTVEEIVIINGIQTLVTNKQEPPLAFKNTGVLGRQPLSRQRLNWCLDLTAQYVNHLVERYVVGSVYMSTVNESAASASERLGGTWEQYHSQDLNGVTTYYYRKTA